MTDSANLVPIIGEDSYGEDNYREAREASAGLGVAQTHLAARAAGFDEWLSSVEGYKLSMITEDVQQALRMPFPSPFVQDIREEAGIPEGRDTERTGWSLGVSKELALGEPYDTGVTLVAARKTKDDTPLRVPLDLVIPTYAYSAARERPDRVVIKVGDRQIPSSYYFKEETAQGLLIVASKFLNLLASGEAAGLKDQEIEINGPKQPKGRIRQLLRRN